MGRKLSDADAGVVGDAAGVVEGDVEVDADERAAACEVEVREVHGQAKREERPARDSTWAASSAMGMRSWAIVSRSRTVTA